MATPEKRDRSTSNEVSVHNRRARHEYFIEDSFEAGLVLTGTEIKSIRQGKITLTEGFARMQKGEAWLENVYVAPYEQGGRENPEDPRRRRKLLMHRQQILRLTAQVSQKGMTLIPLKLYFKAGKAKIELGLGKGKHTYDKRETIAKRDAERSLDRALHSRE